MTIDKAVHITDARVARQQELVRRLAHTAGHRRENWIRHTAQRFAEQFIERFPAPYYVNGAATPNYSIADSRIEWVVDVPGKFAGEPPFADEAASLEDGEAYVDTLPSPRLTITVHPVTIDLDVAVYVIETELRSELDALCAWWPKWCELWRPGAKCDDMATEHTDRPASAICNDGWGWRLACQECALHAAKYDYDVRWLRTDA